MKILIANRGEIAVRIMNACRELGFPSVAIYSDADRDALHSRYADEAVYIGPTQASASYLNMDAILNAARESGAQAIHPGYGFLSENAEFAERVEAAGLIFIGPRPETIALTGDKLAARRVAEQAGVPVLPGMDYTMTNNKPVSQLNGQVSFPLLVKAVSGGGGRGIRLVQSLSELDSMISTASQEAQLAFGNDQVYLEKYIQPARHIEVQVMGDGKGEVLVFGERECSIQRRHQKLIEEAPAPGLSQALRSRLYEAAIRIAKALNYRSLGTIEFLLDAAEDFYFIEVNPRIQVEHPVTEMVTGIDLVIAQLTLAAQGCLHLKQEQIITRGAAIEARVIAEDPNQHFMPTTGLVSQLFTPSGPGVRVDSALYQGLQVTTDYDSLIAKVIVWGEERSITTRRLIRALEELQISGVVTDLPFLKQIAASEAFVAGRVTTSYLDTLQPQRASGDDQLEKEMALAVALLNHARLTHLKKESAIPQNQWRMAAWREQMSGSFI